MKMADDHVQILVDFTVKQRLEKHVKNSEAGSLGYLYGEVFSDKVWVIGCVACRKLNPSVKSGYPGIPDWTLEHAELSSIIPKGIQLCGIYYSCPKSTNLETDLIEEVIKGLYSEQDISSASGQFLVVQMCTSSEVDSQRCFMYDRQAGSITQCEHQEADILGEFLETRISFRIQTNIQISTDYTLDKNGSLAWEIEKSCKELGSTSTVFHLKDCNTLLRNQDDVNIELLDRSKVETCDTLVHDKTSSFSGATKTKGKQKVGKSAPSSTRSKPKEVLEVRLLHQLTETDSDHNVFVPIIQYKKAMTRLVNLNLPVDVVLNLPRSTPLQRLPKLFISAMCTQLRKMASVIGQFSKDGVLSIPKANHFKLPGFCHLVTAVYPGGMSEGNKIGDEQLTSCRVELHKRLLLPNNKPLMRPSNVHVFESERQPGLYLTNPHAGLSGGSCGTVALVDGTYAYHHYMQDNFNDDGWGCAYRSLQTIASWFRYQGYTSGPVPSHRDIQQALVDLQDKGADFVGSRQWIGSFEVGMCLEHLFGVTSKIMFVSSGAELRVKGRDLLHHFQTQGTPIMIGGGVLAHTILGVDFNDQSGDLRFLILDPHYTGGEDLKVILDKGWCGWKGPDFWNQQAHYNMCMPQRPDMI